MRIRSRHGRGKLLEAEARPDRIFDAEARQSENNVNVDTCNFVNELRNTYIKYV